MTITLALAAGVLSGALADDDLPDPDPQAREHAIERAFLDEVAARPYLQYVRLEPRAQGRTLTLLGRAGTELERALIELMARNQPGVGEVKDRIEVDPTLPRWRSGAAEERRTNARNVLRRLQVDPELSAFNTLRTYVDAPGTDDARLIVIRGEVATPAQRERARALASEIVPLASVSEQLVVSPDAARSAPAREPDATSQELERELDSALAADPFVAGLSLTTRVRERSVILVGRVPRALEQDYALEVLRSRVAAFLRSKPEPQALGPLARRLASEGPGRDGPPGDGGAGDPANVSWGSGIAEVPEPGALPYVISSRAIIRE